MTQVEGEAAYAAYRNLAHEGRPQDERILKRTEAIHVKTREKKRFLNVKLPLAGGSFT